MPGSASSRTGGVRPGWSPTLAISFDVVVRLPKTFCCFAKPHTWADVVLTPKPGSPVSGTKTWAMERQRLKLHVIADSRVEGQIRSSSVGVLQVAGKYFVAQVCPGIAKS